MTNRRITVPALFGGVSTQPPAIRRSNQVQSADNALFSVRDAVSKRPGAALLFEMDRDTAVTARLHAIHRDEIEQYLMLYGEGYETLQIWDLDGNEATVNISADAQAYIDANSATADELRPVTVADYTLLVNTTVALTMSASGAYASVTPHRDFDVMSSYSPADASYHETEDDTGARLAGFYQYDVEAATWAYWTYATAPSATVAYYSEATGRSPGGFRIFFGHTAMTKTSVSWDQSEKELSHADFAAYTYAAGDSINVTGGTGVAAEWYTIASKPNATTIELDDEIYAGDNANTTVAGIGKQYEPVVDLYRRQGSIADMYDVALEFQRALQNAGAGDALIYWSDPPSGHFVVVSPYRGSSAFVLACRAPSSGYDWRQQDEAFYNGSPTAGTGSPATNTLAVLDRWDRVPPPSQDDAILDATTLPIQIVRTTVSPLEFTVSTVDWKPRYTGNEDTNPAPSLWENGATISDISFHRNRLVLAGGENVVFSQAGDYFNFFLDDDDNIVDSDPIDVGLSSDSVTLIEYVVPFRKSLVIFTKAGMQFELNAPEALTPNTAAITAATAYQTMENVRPVVMQNRLYFVSSDASGARLYEYYYAESSAANAAADVSAHVEGYIPADIKSIQTVLNHNTVLIIPTKQDGVDQVELYVYRTYWNGDEKVQSAWARWLYNANFPSANVLDVAVIEDYAYLMVETAFNSFVLKQPIAMPAVPYGMPYLPRLDHSTLMTGSYAAGPPAETTFDYTITDLAPDTIVLGPAFGATAGTVLAATRFGDHTVKVAGEYDTGDCYVGEKINLEVQLSQPYVRDQNGAAVLDSTLVLHAIKTVHNDTGYYKLTVAVDGRSDQTYELSLATDPDIETVGDLLALVGSYPEEVTVTIEGDSPKAATVVAAEWTATLQARTM